VRVAGVDLTDVRAIGGGDICTAYAARDRDDRRVFAKTLSAPPPGFFAAEVRGLDLLRVEEAPPVPAVVACGADGLVLE
jgi:fructosamine-3-kinase